MKTPWRLVLLCVPLLAHAFDATADPRGWPEHEAERPLVVAPGLVEIGVTYSESRARQGFDADGKKEPTQPGQPEYIRGLNTTFRYGTFRGFEVSMTVPYILTRRTEILVGEPSGRGLGRIRLASTYQLPIPNFGTSWASGRVSVLLPTTDPELRPDPNSPEGKPLRDSLGATIDLAARRSFGNAAADLKAGYVHTFANTDDIDANRAPAPAWYASLSGTVQASRVFLDLGVRFDRAGRTEIGGEAVPRSDGWTFSLEPGLGFHAHESVDVLVGAQTALAGKNAPRNTVWSLGLIGRF